MSDDLKRAKRAVLLSGIALAISGIAVVVDAVAIYIRFF